MRTKSILLVLLLFPACKKAGDDCSQYGQINVSNVRYMGKSVSGGNGQDGVFFDVSCLFANGCSSINRFIEVPSGDTVTIKAESVYDNCLACTQVSVAQSKTYVFIPKDTGTYYIKWQGLPNRVDTVHIP